MCRLISRTGPPRGGTGAPVEGYVLGGGRIRAQPWVGCCFMWNYTPCAQLPLAADLKCGFYRPTPTQSVKWLSGRNHFLLFAPGPPTRRCLNDTVPLWRLIVE